MKIKFERICASRILVHTVIRRRFFGSFSNYDQTQRFLFIGFTVPACCPPHLLRLKFSVLCSTFTQLRLNFAFCFLYFAFSPCGAVASRFSELSQFHHSYWPTSECGGKYECLPKKNYIWSSSNCLGCSIDEYWSDFTSNAFREGDKLSIIYIRIVKAHLDHKMRSVYHPDHDFTSAFK